MAGCFFSFFYSLLVALFPERLHKAVQFKVILLASKSQHLYRPNPSTKGFITDPLRVQIIKVECSWTRFFPNPAKVQSRDCRISKIENPCATCSNATRKKFFQYIKLRLLQFKRHNKQIV